jgi:hypothetical protein
MLMRSLASNTPDTGAKWALRMGADNTHWFMCSKGELDARVSQQSGPLVSGANDDSVK